MKNVVEAILISMSSVTKPQLLFMMNLFSVLVVFQGKATFRKKQVSGETVISIASWRRKKFNQNLMGKLFGMLELTRDCNKVAQVYDALADYWAITA